MIGDEIGVNGGSYRSMWSVVELVRGAIIVETLDLVISSDSISHIFVKRSPRLGKRTLSGRQSNI